jgi:hypothetical protein
MPGFISNLPVWVIVVIGAVLAYLGYKYWQYRKSTAYGPKISTLRDSDFSTERDNPKNG